MLLSLSPQTVHSFDVIAHRGLSRLHPEHTIHAVKEAMKYKIGYVEPDVVLSKDGIPLIMHDLELDTTTDVKIKFPDRKRSDGRFYAIDFTMEEIKTLRANHPVNPSSGEPKFASRQPLPNSPHQVPTLEEYIQTVQNFNKTSKHHVGIYLEIKAPKFHREHGQDITLTTHNLIKKYRALDDRTPFIIQCFDPETLKRLKSKIQTSFPLIQLIAENSWNESDADYNQLRTQAGLREVARYAAGVGPWLYHLVQNGRKDVAPFTKWAHQAGLKVHTFTVRNDSLPPFVNSEKELLEFLVKEVKADGVFTDNPHTTLKILNSM
jgi:glycerophosphoryl diester phosphodiesterase